MSVHIERHPHYYFPNGTHIFRVENVLYKLHNDSLMAHSIVFKDMFSFGDTVPCPPVEGMSDTNPIFLEGEKQAVFDLFLDHINGRSRSVGSDNPYSHGQLWDLLLFVDKYRCQTTRLTVIDHIWSMRFTYHPAELVHLGSRFNVSKLFISGFKLLLDLPIKRIGKEHRLAMGNDVFIALVYAKSVVEEPIRIIACEEPVILIHADDCPNQFACEEDWHGVWWNGMGRFLLDGRNPQPFRDAIKRFRGLEFGRMGAGCQRLMFQILDRGLAFRYADAFITDICNGLVKNFRLDDTIA